jgi:MOSC domain-containing protein
MAMRVSGLFIYPIKGCRGHAVDELSVDRLGAVGDRRLLLVSPSGRFITQREVSRLATIVPRVTGSCLHVEAPWSEPLELRVDAEGPERAVTIWKDTLTAHDQGDEAAAWFSAAAGSACRLVAWGQASRRPLDPRYAPRPDCETAFTDGYPLLAVTEESFDDVNWRLQHPITIGRFRPNIVLAGMRAWDEDAWRTVTFSGLTCDVVKPCDRCVVTTVDQETGDHDRHQEPLRTLRTFRKVEGRGVLFGQNLVPRDPGVVHMDESVTVT